MKGVLELLQRKVWTPACWTGLREVTVSDAALLYEDRVLGVRWLTQNAGLFCRARRCEWRCAASLVSVDMDATKKATERRRSEIRLGNAAHRGELPLFDG